MKKPGMRGKDRRVDDPQALGSVHLEVARRARRRSSLRADRAGAGGVVAPRIVAHVTPRSSSSVCSASPGSSFGDQHPAPAIRPSASRRTNRTPATTDLRSSSPSSLPSSKYRKLIERRIARVRRAQRHLAGACCSVCALSTTQVRQFGLSGSSSNSRGNSRRISPISA